MDVASHAIQIIPDLNIDQKYTGIISEAQNRIETFIENAVKNGRLHELFELDVSGMSVEDAEKILTFGGRLSVGFQFDSRAESLEENFRIFVRKTLENGKKFKFQLKPQVHEILLQLISLEDRRSVAVFSMLNSSLEMGYRILTSMYGTQLQRLLEKAPEFISGEMAQKLEKLRGGNPMDTADLWDSRDTSGAMMGSPDGRPRGSEDNILSVKADDNTFDEINQLVDQVASRRDRIREKRRQLEENSDLPRSELYWQMVTEDYRQMENCYARMHIYLKAFYKNKNKRNNVRNRILRQYFAHQIENITGETALVEDLLALNEEEYFKNIDRHQELD